MKAKSYFPAIILLAAAIAGIGLMLNHQRVIAPDSVFTTITGHTISLRELRGRPVLIIFWATNCKPCLDEIPQLIRLYNDFHQQGLQVIAVSMHYDQPSRVVNISKARKINYNVALDIRKEHASAFGDVLLIPHTILISPDGYIDMQTTGLIDMQQIVKRIEFFLKG